MALFAAWQQRAATASTASNWTGFKLTKLNLLRSAMGRSDDAMAAGLVWDPLRSSTTAVTAKTGKASQLAHFGEAHAHVNCGPAFGATGESQLCAVEALRHLVAMESHSLPQATHTCNSQQGPPTGKDSLKASAEPTAVWSEQRKRENEELHALADELKRHIAEKGAWINDANRFPRW